MPREPCSSKERATYPSTTLFGNWQHYAHRIRQIVPKLRDAGFTNFFGIIDQDRGEESVGGVFVLGRYAIESYLFDPLVVWHHVCKYGVVPDERVFGQIAGRSYAAVNDSVLQSAADSVIAAVERKFSMEEFGIQRSVVDYANGLRLQYPSWCLSLPKQTTTFPKLMAGKIESSFVEVGLLAMELAGILEMIQRK
jgi:hypothetical protein